MLVSVYEYMYAYIKKEEGDKKKKKKNFKEGELIKHMGSCSAEEQRVQVAQDE